VTLAGSALKRQCHACAFFHDLEEEYRMLLPFLQEGFEQRHKIFQIVDRRHRDERLRRIGALGVDVAMAEESGQLEVRPWESAYLRQGRFDQHAMLALVENVLSEGREQFGLTRLWANMEWSLEDFPGVDDIVEYESRLNDVTSRFEDVVVCTYDLNPVQRHRGDGHPAHAPAGDRRRHSPGEPVLRAAGAVPGRVAGAERACAMSYGSARARAAPIRRAHRERRSELARG
jgi:MEDS: MEthanogen/methylotroph, DcmR Sensory domain